METPPKSYVAGKIQMHVSGFVIEYDADSMIGGNTVFVKVEGAEKFMPVFLDKLDSLVDALIRMRSVVNTLEQRNNIAKGLLGNELLQRL